jgi:Repeat of unknown function (DUF5648)
MKIKATLLTLGLCLAALGAFAQRDDERWERSIQITQGPSVSEETGTEATLTWTTDRPTVTNVRYRVAEGPWRSASEAGRNTNHALRLTGLEPGRHVEWQILMRDGDVRTSGNFRAMAYAPPPPPPRRGGYKPRVPVYRADNPATGQHLYTLDRNEIAYVVEKQGWASAGTAGYIAPTPKIGYVAVFRLYVSNGDHFYTTSMEERDTLLNQGAEDEGVVGYILSSPRPGAYPLHRLVSTKNGYHFYTADSREVAEATRHQSYRDEGVMGYIWLD